jgi:vacuolar-type H+-ATPase subunit B/Vma2
MKKTLINRVLIALFFSLTLALQSCGFSSGLTNQFSLYGNQTTVELSEANFKVLKRAQGTASATYVLGFGGTRKSGLIEEAKAAMMAEIDSEGRAIALANMTVETQTNLAFFVRTYIVVVSADVIEFTE